MEYKRTIRFQYYRILCKRKGENRKWGEYEPFNLVSWIISMDSSNKVQKTIEFNKTLARIDCFSHDEDSDFWGIRFMKLRDTNIPTKVKENKVAEAIELEEDEYIGEDVTLLYEKKSSIAMIQSNRFSLGISRLEEFFTYTNNEENVKVYIEPIVMSNQIGRLKQCNFKSIDISFANLGAWTNTSDNQSLASIISTVKRTGGLAGRISIGLGHTKKDTLDRVESQSIINEIFSNKRFIRSAKAKVREDDDTDVEIIDLFEEVYHDFLDFTLRSKAALEYRDAMLSMIYALKRRKSALYLAIDYHDEDD